MLIKDGFTDTRTPARTDMAPDRAGSPPGAFSRLELDIVTDLANADRAWQDLGAVAIGTPYQTFGWLKAWAETIGKRQGVEPVIACGQLAGRVVFILPLGMERQAGVRALTFLGHRNGNQNTGFWDPEYYAIADSAHVRALLEEICARQKADLIALNNVPEVWHGRRHPLVLEGATASPSPIFVRDLPADFEDLFRDTHSKSSRKNLLRKQRHLQALKGFRIGKAEREDEIREVLAAFFAQRSRRAAEAGIPNAFGEVAAQDFIGRVTGAAGVDVLQEKPPLGLWYLEADGAVRATYLCAEHGGTIYAYSNSVAHDALLPNSPGLVLVKEIIANACASADLHCLDLGLGEERYKSAWAEPVALKDSFLAATPRGRMKRSFDLGRSRLKTRVRNSALLWSLVRRLRKWKAGGSNRPQT
ncbi:GNAT family N-acetyltransferase [Rhodobacterales bacterium]|nr:GNAT family N-acetyltransferase [Rhodobacterales bacterium]